MLQRAGMLLDQGLSGVQGGTFHAFAYGVLRRWRPAWLGEPALHGHGFGGHHGGGQILQG